MFDIQNEIRENPYPFTELYYKNRELEMKYNFQIFREDPTLLEDDAFDGVLDEFFEEINKMKNEAIRLPPKPERDKKQKTKL